MKVIDMIRNISQRNSVVNSSDVQVIFSELDKSNYRIGELQKDNDTLRAMMREVEIQRDALKNQLNRYSMSAGDVREALGFKADASDLVEKDEAREATSRCRDLHHGDFANHG